MKLEFRYSNFNPMDLYREEILAHWQNPLNFGVMEKPDLVIEQVNPLCGDEVTFFFKFEKKANPKSPTTPPRLRLGLRRASEIRNPKNGKSSNKWKMENMRAYFSSKKGEWRIKEVTFTGSGCAISIASASLLSQVIKGKSIDKISQITGQDVLELIGGPSASNGFPPARLKCAFLALEALRKLPSLRLRTSRVNSQEISN